MVSGGIDRTIKLWDVPTGNCLKTLQGHSEQVTSATFIDRDRTIISSSLDGTMKLWDVKSGQCWKTLRVPRPYEGIDIAGTIGITEGQKETLKALGAVDNLN